jgi:predicted permease
MRRRSPYILIILSSVSVIALCSIENTGIDLLASIDSLLASGKRGTLGYGFLG